MRKSKTTNGANGRSRRRNGHVVVELRQSVDRRSAHIAIAK